MAGRPPRAQAQDHKRGPGRRARHMAQRLENHLAAPQEDRHRAPWRPPARRPCSHCGGPGSPLPGEPRSHRLQGTTKIKEKDRPRGARGPAAPCWGPDPETGAPVLPSLQADSCLHSTPRAAATPRPSSDESFIRTREHWPGSSRTHMVTRASHGSSVKAARLERTRRAALRR